MNESEYKPSQELKEFQPLSVEWQIPSELTGFNVYRDKFEQLLTNSESSWIKPDDIMGLTLGFDEALVNAIKYGNKEDASKIVEVIVNIDEEKLEVSVQDQNPEPFNPDTAFDSVSDESEKLANHGRGITLMRTLYDSVVFEFMNPGNKVTLTKYKENSP